MAYNNGLRQKTTMVSLALRGKALGVPTELVALIEYATAAGLTLEQLSDMLSISRTTIRGWMEGREVSGSMREAVFGLARVLGVGVALGVLPAPPSHLPAIMKLLRRGVALRTELDEMTEIAAGLRAKYEASPEAVASFTDPTDDDDETAQDEAGEDAATDEAEEAEADE